MWKGILPQHDIFVIGITGQDKSDWTGGWWLACFECAGTKGGCSATTATDSPSPAWTAPYISFHNGTPVGDLNRNLLEHQYHWDEQNNFKQFIRTSQY